MTPKQERFVCLYVETGNASEAYRQAYNAGKMKAESINRKAKELLDNGKIAARIAKLQATHRKRHEITVDKPQPENATDSPPVIIELVAPQTEEHWETH